MDANEGTVAIRSTVRARRTGFATDLATVASRALRLLPRDAAAIVPALIVPVFFYAVTIGALQDVFDGFGGTDFDYKAFQLPVAIVTTVTGLSRANALVTDIQGGYFDRMMLTPVNRASLLLGLMVADLVLFVALCLPVVALGYITGVRFATGLLGVGAFVGLGALWGLMYTGFPYAIALKTGNPTAVNNSFLLFFPFAFLTTAWVPEAALTGWLRAIATVNPVTYLLAGLRSMTVEWDAVAVAKALLAIGVVGAVAQALAFASLRGRTKRS